MAKAVFLMLCVLISEVSDSREHGVAGGLPQPAEGCIRQVFGQGFQKIGVPRLRPARCQIIQNDFHFFESLAAGDALPARFIRQKADEVAGNIHHAGAVIHDDHAAGPHHGSRTRQCIKVNGQIKGGFGKAPA